MSQAGDIINGLIKAAIYDLALKAAIERIVIQVPFLAWPVINPVFVFIMERIAGMLFAEMKTRVDFALIDFETERDRVAYEQAVEELRQINLGEKPPTDEEIENAREQIRNRLSDFIPFPAL